MIMSSINLNPNDYDPISTLHKQYSTDSNSQTNHNGYNDLGKRIILILKLNKACIIPGGIQKISSGTVINGSGGNEYYTILNQNNNFIDTSSNNSTATISTSNYGSHNNNNSSNYSDNNMDPINHDFNAMTLQNNYNHTQHQHKSKNQQKFSSIFAKAKNTIEKGVTSIAVQAQKQNGANNGPIRDIIIVGAYLQDHITGQFNSCIGMTEQHTLPMIQHESNDQEEIVFQIPIVVPPHVFQQQQQLNMQNHNQSLNIKFNIWMRSGAAIFAKNRALRKYYSLGNTMLNIPTLIQVIQPKQYPVSMELPVQSPFIHSGDGKMTIMIIPDTKFPPLCGNGWSLTDPRVDTAYSDHYALTATASMPGKKILYNPPLDQTYIYPYIPPKEIATRQLQHQHQHQHHQQDNIINNNNHNMKSKSILITTERTTESTLVLPLAVAFSELVSNAAEKSTNHAKELVSRLQCVENALSINDPIKAMQLGHAQVQVDIIHFLRYSPSNNNTTMNNGGGSAHIMINLQRPDSIFENCIATGTVPSLRYIQNATYSQHPSISVPFYPRIVLSSDPRILPGEATSTKSFYLGKLRFELSEQSAGGSDVFSPIGPAGAVGATPRQMEAIVDIDMYVNLKTESLIQATVVDLKTGSSVGILVLKLAANTMEGLVDRCKDDVSTNSMVKQSAQPILVEDGLISLVGLDTLMEDDKACYPHSDLNFESSSQVFAKLQPSASNADRLADRRKRQIATMGEFLTYTYLNNHVKAQRMSESQFMNEKFEAYKVALFTPSSEAERLQQDNLPPDKRKDPRPFRPSSSRMEPILCSIGFNVHVQNFTITTATTDVSTGKSSAVPSALLINVTCGAPADHFRGFSKKGQTSEASISGGLRRLETMRHATSQYVRDCQNRLIEAVGNFYTAQSQHTNIHLPGRSERHISPSNHELSALRTTCIAATQKLHTLTWEIATRRSNVFSQALGIAVTLYLSHVSDTAKLQKGAWAELWQKHGFLVVFEGLLSAAGKELGMIEDAAVGISMLRMASIVIVTEQSKTVVENTTCSSCIPVPDSSYIKWVRINTNCKGTKTSYSVEVCVDENYYTQKIPSALKGNTAIRFFPILYEMGVDVRQWGSNVTKFGNNNNNDDGLDDDEVGIPDNDVLIALNYEAFCKMNAYAHSVYRCNEDPSVSWEQAHHQARQQEQLQVIHPILRNLYEYIKSSAGKMEHGILDEAAHATARLGGGSAIFCKSGKDRTAMQVTFKQSQFVNRFIVSGGDGLANHDKASTRSSVTEKATSAVENNFLEKVYKDAAVMRVYGTRLPICDKNVGQPLYAFNALQARFMPEALKPPPRALAGFLKGGRVFSREGMIES